MGIMHVCIRSSACQMESLTAGPNNSIESSISGSSNSSGQAAVNSSGSKPEDCQGQSKKPMFELFTTEHAKIA